MLLYDEVRQLVVPVGSHGIEQWLLTEVYGTLEETPIAQLALSEDRVVEVSGELDALGPRALRALRRGRHPHLHARLRRRALARRDLRRPRRRPLRADRRGAPHDVDARQDGGAGRQRAHRHQPAGPGAAAQARIDLAREMHDRVMQRLFGVSLVLGSEHGLLRGGARRCADEMQAALVDLREALARPLAPPSLDTGATLREELDRLGRHYKDLPLELEWEEGVEVPAGARAAGPVGARRGAAQRRQARPAHERAGARGRARGTFVLEVRNDGATAPNSRGTGMGLRLAAVEALQRGALVEFGPEGDSDWRVRLVVPLRRGAQR